MSPYDSDNKTVSNQADTELADAYQGADRISRKYRFPLKVAAFYALTIGIGYAIHVGVDGPLANLFAALMVYFTLLFAAVTVLAGVLIKLAGMARVVRRSA